MDEAVNIERCIASLAWCDAVVVVDSGSTDDTVSIATRLGAKTFTHLPDGPFRISEQRNWALDHCDITTEWVLFVDADEVIPAPLVDQIVAACTADTTLDAFQLAPKYLFLGAWMKRSMGYPNWHDRLLRRDAVRLDGGVWEHFPPGTRTGRLSEPYLHYANSKGFTDWLTRHDRYSTWDAEQVTAYLAGGGDAAFGTNRNLRMRRAAARVWPLRPVLRFLVMYVIRRGFLDGPPALILCIRYAIYEYMTVEKIVEGQRRKVRAPL